MAHDPTEIPLDTTALGDAIQRARAELEAMRGAASEADTTTGKHHDYTLHEVPETGRYALPHHAGWQALLGLIDDHGVGIGFSPAAYPLFDQRVLAHAEEPLEDSSLRANIAAVRNYLMQTYYADDAAGMTPEKARQSLEEISAFVGDGLKNALLPVEDPRAPYLDRAAVAQPGGLGAQYLYEKIREADRQSNWLRPFSAVIALFGGKLTEDWKLPEACDTPFMAQADFSPMELGPEAGVDEIEAALAYIDGVEQQRRALQDEMQLNAQVDDLDMLGNQLVHTVTQLQDVSQMSEPVRRDAVEIAKDILRKLKVSLGATIVKDGLALHTPDDVAALGAIAGVAKIYERLLAWGRGIDASILQHPSIIAATQAIGQLAVAAKMEAMRVAKQARDDSRAAQLAAQIRAIPEAFHPGDAPLGEMFERIERGIDTVLNRVQAISGPGAMVGHVRGNDLGNYMSGTPIAGIAMQASAEGVTNRDATGKQQALVQESIANTNRAQLQRAAQQLATQQARSSGNTTTTTTTQARSGNSARGNIAAQLAAARQRLVQARQAATNQQGVRAATSRTAVMAIHHHEEEDHHHQQQQLQQQEMMARLAKKMDLKGMRAATSTAGLTTNPVVTGKAAFDKMQRAATGGLKPPATPTDKDKKDPPPPPVPKGHTR